MHSSTPRRSSPAKYAFDLCLHNIDFLLGPQIILAQPLDEVRRGTSREGHIAGVLQTPQRCHFELVRPHMVSLLDIDRKTSRGSSPPRGSVESRRQHRGSTLAAI